MLCFLLAVVKPPVNLWRPSAHNTRGAEERTQTLVLLIKVDMCRTISACKCVCVCVCHVTRVLLLKWSLRAPGRRVNWMLTHAETDTHTNTNTNTHDRFSWQLSDVITAGRRRKEKKACSRFRRWQPSGSQDETENEIGIC